MKQTHARRTMFILKIIMVLLITCLILPFYDGNSSVLDSYEIAEKSGQDTGLEAGNDNRVKPPAKVEYDNMDAESTAPVQVMPMPSSAPSAVSDLSEGSESNTGSKQDKDLINEASDELEQGSIPAFQPAESEKMEDENTEEVTANTGLLLQNLLDQCYRHEGEKVAYLTFDDGPTPQLTDLIMDILKEENVKATFFPIGSNAEAYPWLVERAYAEGHGIGNHSYSHAYRHIYTKPQNLIDELVKTEKILQSILGEDKSFRLVRFPGGSFGNSLEHFREAVNQAGFGYIDWNSLNGDAESVKSRSAKKLVARLKQTVKGQSGLIVLMHDAPGKGTTAEALPEIIEFLRSEGYRFELLPGSR